MLTTGFSLAILTSAGFLLIYHKLPASIRGFVQRHVLLTDISACILTYMLFGGTIVALFAAAFTGLFVSFILALLQDERTAAAVGALAKKLIAGKDALISSLAKICEQHQAKPAE